MFNIANYFLASLLNLIICPRSGFPHSFVRSKLSVLPEEQGTLTRRRAREAATSVAGEAGPQSLTSELSTLELTNMPAQASTVSVQRKRSQSLADIQVRIAWTW